MRNKKSKCIILLSTKSSGSSALQNLISKSNHVKHVVNTRHGQNETLYWVKAASILGLPQIDMLDSEVPISAAKARKDLVDLLKSNLQSFRAPSDDREFVFSGWEALCEEYSPVLFEKSPHHLHQWSALELINECVEKYPSIEFLIIGLVRNPMDVIYSRWSLNRTLPEKYQYEWLGAYKNLLEFHKVSKARMLLIRYEEMVTNVDALKDIYEFIDDPDALGKEKYLHKRSISKWKKDKRYGFQLADDVIEFASQFGYKRDEMINTPKATWSVEKRSLKVGYKLLQPLRFIRKVIRKHLKVK